MRIQSAGFWGQEPRMPRDNLYVTISVSSFSVFTIGAQNRIITG
jgi:hypothetical protein